MLFPRNKARLVFNAKWRRYQNAKNRSGSASSQSSPAAAILAVVIVFALAAACGWFK